MYQFVGLQKYLSVGFSTCLSTLIIFDNLLIENEVSLLLIFKFSFNQFLGRVKIVSCLLAISVFSFLHCFFELFVYSYSYLLIVFESSLCSGDINAYSHMLQLFFLPFPICVCAFLNKGFLRELRPNAVGTYCM